MLAHMARVLSAHAQEAIVKGHLGGAKRRNSKISPFWDRQLQCPIGQFGKVTKSAHADYIRYSVFHFRFDLEIYLCDGGRWGKAPLLLSRIYSGKKFGSKRG